MSALALTTGSAFFSSVAPCRLRISVLLLDKRPHECSPKYAAHRENNKRTNDISGAHLFVRVIRPAGAERRRRQSPAEHAVEQNVAHLSARYDFFESLWFHAKTIF